MTDDARPYCAWSYPIVPALYIAVAAAASMIDLLVTRPRCTSPRLLLALSAVPVY